MERPRLKQRGYPAKSRFQYCRPLSGTQVGRRPPCPRISNEWNFCHVSAARDRRVETSRTAFTNSTFRIYAAWCSKLFALRARMIQRRRSLSDQFRANSYVKYHELSSKRQWNTNYNGLQLDLRKAFSHGLSSSRPTTPLSYAR